MKNKKVLFIILFLAICIRLIYLLYYNSLPDWTQLTVDNYYHHNWAINIANGNIFGDTTYFRAPFYVYILGFLYSILGTSLWVGRLFGLIVGLLSIILTYMIGKKAFNHRIGLIAAFIHTIYPLTIYFESELLLDPLFMLLLQLVLYRLLLWINQKTYKNAFLIGLFMGLAVITRPTILVWVAPILLISLIYKKQIPYCSKQILYFLSALIIVIAPITVRNLIIAEDPVLVASQGGINFYIGNNPEADGVSAVLPEPMGYNWQISQVRYIAETETGQKLLPGEISSFWFKKGIDWITNNPVEFVTLYLKKSYFNISNREISNNRDLKQFFQQIPILRYNPVSFGILFIFSVLGILFQWKKNPTLKLYIVLILTYILASSLFFFNSRFRLPLLPFYFILSAVGVTSLFTFNKDNTKRVILNILILSIALFITYYPIVAFSKGNSPQAMLSKGNYYFAQSDYNSSLKYNRKAYKIDSLFPEVNLNIGNCFLKLGNIDSAQYYFQQEIKYHPGREKGYVNLATIKYLNSNYQESINLAYRAKSLNPYNLTVHQVLLRSIFADTAFDNETCFQKALESSKILNDDIYLLNESSVLLSGRGMLLRAEEFLIKAVNSSPPPIETDDEAFRPNFRNSPKNIRKQRAFSNFQLGYIKGIQENYGESIRFSIKAIHLDSTLSDAYVNLINGYMVINQNNKADSVLSRALEIFPSYSPLQRLRKILFQ